VAKHNLRTVVGFEVRRTLTKRRFWIFTLLVPIAIAIVFALVFVSNSSTNKSLTSQKNSKFSFIYTDSSGIVSDSLVQKFGGRLGSDVANSISKVRSGKIDAYFEYPAHPASETTKIFGVDKGVFDNGKYESVAKLIIQLSAQEKIGSASLAVIGQGNVKTITNTYNNGRKSV
jgi:ABC-2 type transport system permease protein